MKKYVIVSSNGNVDYEWYIDLVEWAWKRLGWETIVMRPFQLDNYREITITQCIRLYAASDLVKFQDDDILMTSDADMIPLSDYWKPDPNKITVYGHDLTKFKHIPICYVAMNARNWRNVMNLNNNIKDCMHRDLINSRAMSIFKFRWWYVDQDILTDRLSFHQIEKVNRGFETNSKFAFGRVDRASHNFPSALIDYHVPRSPTQHIKEIKNVIFKAFGECPSFL